jgi:hypothetical protein
MPTRLMRPGIIRIFFGDICEIHSFNHVPLLMHYPLLGTLNPNHRRLGQYPFNTVLIRFGYFLNPTTLVRITMHYTGHMTNGHFTLLVSCDCYLLAFRHVYKGYEMYSDGQRTIFSSSSQRDSLSFFALREQLVFSNSRAVSFC